MAAPPGAAAPGRVTVAAVGDIRLDGPVGGLIAKRGPGYPTSALGAALEADIVFGNLECPVTMRGVKQPKTWNFRAPARNLAALKPFTLVGLANNHSWDYGERGFLDTLDALKKAKLPYVGGGKDRAEAEALRVIVSSGVRVGFMAFTSTFPKEAWAKRRKPGVAYSDFSRFPEVIRKARKECDTLVVSFHGGTELAQEPNEIQQAFARAAIDAGADLVLGHHPHVLQPLELYRGKVILYSLGNFLFVSPTPSTRPTVVARAELGLGGVLRLDFVPFDTADGRPVPADVPTREAVKKALDRFGALTQFPDRFRVQ